MKFKKITPQKIVLGFQQVIYTFSQTARLVWSANPRLLLFSFLANILAGLLVFPTLYIEKMTIDALVQNIGNPFWEEALRFLTILFLIRVTIGVFQSALGRISSLVQFTIARVFSAHIDILLGEKMSSLDMETIDDSGFQDRFNKVERESGRRAWGLAMPLAQIPNFFFGLLSSFSLLFLFNPFLSLIVFLLAIPEFFVDAKFTKLEYEFETRVALKYRVWGWFNHYLTASRCFLETKVLGLSPFFVKRIKGLQNEIFQEASKIRTKKETYRFLTFLPQNIFVFFFSLYLGLLSIKRQVSVGSAQMYLRAIYSFQGNLTGLVGAFLDLYENYLFVSDLIWYLNIEPKMSSGKRKIPSRLKKGIEFKDVWFRYKKDQPWILRGINLSISAEENLAIVGENGAGKTTLIKLLCRFYDPQKGEILIDGINLKEYERSSLWTSFSILFQDFESFPFTARESIGYGKISEVENLDLISRSAQKSAIGDFIESLPLKYENPLDPQFEKGVRPSTGQWQRIGLARILVRNAQIVILDEPTSNVDPKSEEEIFEKIIEFVQKKNLILISHRFSTVRRAKKICVMDKGKIVEYGTHEELHKQKGIYSELFNLQAKSYK